jgi:hypothetical protein
MKTKKRIVPYEEWNALHDMLRAVSPILQDGSSTTVWMITGDLEPTQNLAEARWIMTDSQMDARIFQVDGIGDAIFIDYDI